MNAHYQSVGSTVACSRKAPELLYEGAERQPRSFLHGIPLLIFMLAMCGGPAWAQSASGGTGGTAGTAGAAGQDGFGPGGAGGAAGVLPGANGGDGFNGVNGGAGGGGGGGQYGNGTGTAVLANSGSLIGGNGGAGGGGSLGFGNSGGNAGPGGAADQGGVGGLVGTGNQGANGGGGAGGAGALVTGSNAAHSNSGTLQGGNGGNGSNAGEFGTISASGGGGGSGIIFSGAGNSFSNASGGVVIGGTGGSTSTAFGTNTGNGGAGGHGVSGNSLTVTSSGTISGGTGGTGGFLNSNRGGRGGDGITGIDLTIINNVGAAINGGNGGSGIPLGSSSGPAGAGGVGITGSNVSIINAGAISGGLNGSGVWRANAITFTGGTNRLELQAGWSITGNVDAFTGSNTLVLGGANNSSFEASAIGWQFQGFQFLEKTGPSTWILTGTSSTSAPWSILGGTLQINDDSSLGLGDITIANGATLATTSDIASFRHVTLNSGGGTFDVAPGTTFTMSGGIDGMGGLTKTDTGTLVFSGASTFSGPTNVNAGTLQAGAPNTLSPNSAVTVASVGTLDLADFDQTVTGLTNAGLVRIGTGTPRNTVLTVDGNYVGAGGILEIKTVLGDDTSATDRLVVMGDVSGQSDVHVINLDGEGAPTVNGIEIIRIGGASPRDAFTLSGDYTTKDGQSAVIGGAYAYTLHHNGIANPTDGNWYLRSTLQQADDEDDGQGQGDGGGGGDDLPGDPNGPRYSASVPVYEAYPQVLQAMNRVATLQQRVGNRYSEDAPAPADPVFCTDTTQNFRCASRAGQNVVYTDGNGNYTVDQNGIWGRIEGAHSRFRPHLTTASSSYDVNVYRMQAGVDGLFYESDAGRLVGGFNVQYAHGKADIRSFFGDGEISTDGYGVGGTLTWYGNNGYYVDGQAQAIWYNSDLTSLADSITRPGLSDSNNGLGYALSLESGKRIELSDGWSVTPQAQLVYSSVDFDSFSDGYGTSVSLDRGNSLQGRLGVSLDRQISWTDGNGQTARSHLYGIANLYNEFLDGSRVKVAGVPFDSRNERLWGGLGLGASYNWANDKYSVYGEGSLNTSLTGFADSYTVKGTLGFRVRF